MSKKSILKKKMDTVSVPATKIAELLNSKFIYNYFYYFLYIMLLIFNKQHYSENGKCISEATKRTLLLEF